MAGPLARRHRRLDGSPMPLPSIAQFIRATITASHASGLENFLPTIAVEDDFYVVEGIPDDLDHRKALQDTIVRDDLMQQDFLFAVRSGDNEVTVGEHFDGELDFFVIRKLDDGFHHAPLAVCEWWDVPT